MDTQGTSALIWTIQDIDDLKLLYGLACKPRKSGQSHRGRLEEASDKSYCACRPWCLLHSGLTSSACADSLFGSIWIELKCPNCFLSLLHVEVFAVESNAPVLLIFSMSYPLRVYWTERLLQVEVKNNPEELRGKPVVVVQVIKVWVSVQQKRGPSGIIWPDLAVSFKETCRGLMRAVRATVFACVDVFCKKSRCLIGSCSCSIIHTEIWQHTSLMRLGFSMTAMEVLCELQLWKILCCFGFKNATLIALAFRKPELHIFRAHVQSQLNMLHFPGTSNGCPQVQFCHPFIQFSAMSEDVSSCRAVSYEARKFGVKRWAAKFSCPTLNLTLSPFE